MPEPLIIDPRFLRPLPISLWDAPCAKCDKRQSRWELGLVSTGEVHPTCSLCFLYETPWGEKRAAQIDEYLRDVEEECGENFLRGADGRTLLSCKDANKVLGAIAHTSRMIQLWAAERQPVGEGGKDA